MESLIHLSSVALIKENNIFYSKIPPYHPSEKYPEMSFLPISESDNPAYRAVRLSLFYLGLDKKNYGSINWNPLRKLVQPHDKVIIKPNLVFHENHKNLLRSQDPRELECLVTHGSIIRVIIDYVAKALKFKGRILITDCPIQGADWDVLMRLISAAELKKYVNDFYPDIFVDFKDYRMTVAEKQNGRMIRNNIINNDFHMYKEVDLHQKSLLMPLIRQGAKFGVAEYSHHRMSYAHSLQNNKYLIPKEILDSDVIINLPKMKTHKKGGITGALKNFVGINGHKDYLPHFCYGSPDHCGDEYPQAGPLIRLMWFLQHKNWEHEHGKIKAAYHYLDKILIKLHKMIYGRDFSAFGKGSWHGNDTLWRMILDINRALFYYDSLKEKISDHLSGRKCFTLVDGIISGEGEGPLMPDYKETGIVLAGFNPVAIDAVAAAMMGFDPEKIKHISQAFTKIDLPLVDFALEEIEIKSNIDVQTIADIFAKKKYNKFIPSRGFSGKIEYQPESLQSDKTP